jgi:hypothetical protein
MAIPFTVVKGTSDPQHEWPPPPTQWSEGNRGHDTESRGRLAEVGVGEAKLPASPPHIHPKLLIISANGPRAQLGVAGGDGHDAMLPDVQIRGEHIVRVHTQVWGGGLMHGFHIHIHLQLIGGAVHELATRWDPRRTALGR